MGELNVKGKMKVLFTYLDKSVDLVGFSENDYIYQKIKSSSGFYELALLSYMQSVLPKSSLEELVIFDVGGNIGNHSVFFGLFIADHVVAIEPNEAVIPYLKRNLETNLSTDKFTLFPVGLGASSSYGELALPIQNNIGSAKIEMVNQGSIRIQKLDDVFTDWVGCDVKHQSMRLSAIKIDVEGMELEVLKGGTQLLNDAHPELFVEAASKVEFDSIAKFLLPYGYVCLSQWGATPMYHFSYNPKISFKVKCMLSSWHHKLRAKYRAIYRRFLCC